MKKWTVYLPVVCSEVYEHVEAETAEEAIALARNDQCECVGEIQTGREKDGQRAVLEKPSNPQVKLIRRFDKKRTAQSTK